MRRWLRLLPVALIVGCSDLDEGEAGIVALEIRVPSPEVVEVGETLQLSAKPLDANGDSVAAPVAWRTADPSFITIGETTGLVTGLGPGTARVQATSGSLSSALVNLRVVAPADTLVLAGDSVVIAPALPGTASLTVRLDSRNPAGVAGPRPVVFEITRPTVPPFAVTLPGDDLTETVESGSDGTAAVTVSRAAGTAVPDSVFVVVSATRTRGAIVPGSGQRFIVLFQ